MLLVCAQGPSMIRKVRVVIKELRMIRKVSDSESASGDEAVVEFVKVKRKGKISVQALVNNVKFYCNRTVQDGQ